MLNLSVPGTDPVLQQSVETRAKAVSAWLERLPFANPIETAQQLVMALYGLNRHPLGEDDRYTLMALYRPAVARASASLESLLADAGVPPYTQQRQVGALLRELQIEHSIGYKQTLLALNNRRFGRAPPKRQAEVSARLLAALRDVQMACHLAHTAPPAGLWQDMHQLYAYARAANFADLAVDDAPSVSLAYCQALLFALADPPHLSHSELLHTRLYLEKFAGLSMLTTAPVSGHYGFAVRADGDAAPGHAEAPETSGLWLDTDAMCRSLHEMTGRLRAGKTPRALGLPDGVEGELCTSLCKRLLKQWSEGTQRMFRRFASTGSTVQIVGGVSAIHRLLTLGTTHDTPAASAESNSPANSPFTEWTVSNDSASGLALTGTPDTPLNLKAGDALAVRGDNAAGWALGVIRWVRMRDARQVELGVERLAPQMESVSVRPLRGERTASAEPALFVSGLAVLKQNDRLLLPRHLYQIGMDAEIVQGANTYALTFGRRVEQTPSFDLIDFTLVPVEQP